MAENKILSEVGVGEVFKVAGVEFIKFYDDNGNTAAVAKNILFDSVFGDNNNFAKSDVLKKLKKEVLAKIVKEIGAENVMEHEVDLTSVDGSNVWGKMKTKISLPTLAFYRKYEDIFDKYPLRDLWWLATPDTTTVPYESERWGSCIGWYGHFEIEDCDLCHDVRPLVVFSSSLSVVYSICY